MNGYIAGIICGTIVWAIGYVCAPAPGNNGTGQIGDFTQEWRSFLRYLLGFVTAVVIGLLFLQGLQVGSFEFTWAFTQTFAASVAAYFALRYGVLYK